MLRAGALLPPNAVGRAVDEAAIPIKFANDAVDM